MADCIRLLSVSSNASNNLSDGHYRSVYQSLFDYSESKFEYLGTISSNAGSEIGIYKLLSRGAKFSSFGPILRSKVRRDSLIIRDFVQQRNLMPDIVQIYEGGLRELLLAIQLADFFPKTLILFNFFFGNDWVNFAEVNGPIASKLKAAIEQHPNLVLSADTTPLAGYLTNWLGIEILIYPVFSSLRTISEKKSMPGLLITLTDMRYSNLCLRLIEQLGQTIPTTIIIPPWLHSNSSGNFGKKACGLGAKVYNYSLDVKTYYKLLEESSFHLLLHSPEKYMFQSSGRFEDSLLTSSLTLAPASLAFLKEPGRLHLTNCGFNENAEDGGLGEILASLLETKRSMPPGRSVKDLIKWLRKLHENQEIEFSSHAFTEVHPLEIRSLNVLTLRSISITRLIAYVLLLIGLPRGAVSKLSQLRLGLVHRKTMGIK